MNGTGINYVLIAAAAILILSVIIGGVRGFIKTFFSAFSVIIAIFLAVQIGPYLGKSDAEDADIYIHIGKY